MIPKRYYKSVEKFNEELKQFNEYTGEEVATLYEDQYTSFTLSDIRIEDNKLKYNYDGSEDYDTIEWEYDGDQFEDYDSITESLRFWRGCLKRAKRYWSMDSDMLDKLQNGEIEEED